MKLRIWCAGDDFQKLLVFEIFRENILETSVEVDALQNLRTLPNGVKMNYTHIFNISIYKFSVATENCFAVLLEICIGGR